MGRPRLPPVPHVPAAKGAATFVCRGACGLRWPRSQADADENECANCRRARKRARPLGSCLVCLEADVVVVRGLCRRCGRALALLRDVATARRALEHLLEPAVPLLRKKRVRKAVPVSADASRHAKGGRRSYPDGADAGVDALVQRLETDAAGLS